MNRGKMETMTKLGLIAILATAASAGFADSKPDRSGESILREMFMNHAKLQGAHALIWVGRSTAPDLPFLFDRSIELCCHDLSPKTSPIHSRLPSQDRPLFSLLFDGFY